MTTATYADLDTTIARIRTALRKRSGKAWSVRRGEGTAYGWITIEAPPSRQVDGANTTEELAELAALLGLETVHHQGESIPSGGAYRAEYIDRAEGRTPSVIGQQYWD